MRKAGRIDHPDEGLVEQDPFTEVIERAAAGDPDAWSRIYERFAGSLFGFFLHQVRDREVAED
ncbi:MAG TPA: hypothetical protein VII47_08235, partial [Actinomycetota bacterium]